MIEVLNQIDTQCFRWINTHHTPALDWVMWTLSQHWCWLIVLALLFCATTLRLEPRRWWIVLIAIGACFLLADQGSVHLFKNQVQRLRPCWALEDVRMFRTHCGGAYGFVSSHAANAFAIVTFLCLTYSNNIKSIAKGYNHPRTTLSLSLLWAIATCYSRAYLGKHYPGDLVCGALFGAVVGWVVWLLVAFFDKKQTKSETKQ